MQKESVRKYGQAVGFLPQRLREAAIHITDEEKQSAEEFRLRAGRVMSLVIRDKEIELGSSPVRHEELESVLELATRGSVHTAETSIREGYITVSGGHRIGVCGTFVKTGAIRDVSSVCIRIAKAVETAAEGVWSQLSENGKFKNTLIISPPGYGKTTMLRDLVRRISDSGFRVSLIDERGEIAAKRRGMPQFDVGRCTDVLDGIEKAKGASLMLRAMSPEIIALDEITAEADMRAVTGIFNCGVGVMATVHGNGVKEVFSRPLFAPLKELRAFECALVLGRVDGKFTYNLCRIEEGRI